MAKLKRLLGGSAGALVPVVATALALVVGAGMLLALGADPLTAYAAMGEGAFGSVGAIAQTLVKATPLLLVGLGVTIAFRGGVINIGGEGQLIVGALSAGALALALPGTPGLIVLPLCMLAGAAAGAVWGGVPGALKARLGVNEILSTIMMNQIAIQVYYFMIRGPLIDPMEIERGTRIAQSAEMPVQAWLARLVPRTSLHAGAIIAVVLAVLVYIFLWRTSVGYRIRAVGLNPDASRYAGINVALYQVLALALGGMFAGLAGSLEVLGVHRRLIEGLSGGYGFSGIVAALFGKLHPLGAIPASVLFGGLLVGAQRLQRAVQVPSFLVDTMLGLVVLFVVSSDIWVRSRARRRQIADSTPAGVAPSEAREPAAAAEGADD
jgi:simple sugar transport system permease protein